MAENQNRGCLSFLFPKLNTRDISVTELPSDNEETTSYPYRASDRFLSPAEYSFFMVSKKVLSDRFVICPQVPLSAIFFITDKQNYTAAYNKISRKRIDYLVCDGLTVKPLFGIELDDKSHERNDRIERDIFVENVFEASGMPLIRVPLKNAYSTSDLESIFAGVLRSINWQPSQPGKSNTPHIEQEPDEIGNPPKCPKCGGEMVIRTARNGPKHGEKFFGCSNYPHCKTFIPIKETRLESLN